MFVLNNTVRFTSEDLNGFTFSKVNNKISYKRYKKLKNKLLNSTFIFIMLISICLSFFIFKLYLFLVLFTLPTIVYLFVVIHNFNSLFDISDNISYYEYTVKVKRKLNLESVDGNNFYPVLCVDLKSGYEGICYISETKYLSIYNGDIVSLIVDKSLEEEIVNRSC